MRSATIGGPAALATNVCCGDASRPDGATLANDHEPVGTAAMNSGCSWRSRSAIWGCVDFAGLQHVRRACPCGVGGQQHRFSALTRIASQGCDAATVVEATALATRMASNCCTPRSCPYLRSSAIGGRQQTLS